MVIFQVLLEFILSALVQLLILLGEIGDFVRSKINVVFINSAKIARLYTLCRFFSLIVDDPVNMEILNATHDCLDEMKRDFALSILISSQDSPKLSQ